MGLTLLLSDFFTSTLNNNFTKVDTIADIIPTKQLFLEVARVLQPVVFIGFHETAEPVESICSF